MRESAYALSRSPALSASSDWPRITRDWSISCWARSVETVAPSAGAATASNATMVRRAVRARRIDETLREVRLPSLGSPNRADDTQFRPPLSAFARHGPRGDSAACDVGHRGTRPIRGLAGRAGAGLLRSGQTDPQGGGRHGDRNGHASRTSSTASSSTRPRAAPTAVINPSTGAEIAQAPDSGAEDVDRAVKAARTAFETLGHARRPASARWRSSSSPTRSRSAPTRSPSSSRPTPASRSQAFKDDEIPAMVDNLRFFAGAARSWRARRPASTSRATPRSSAASPSASSARSRRGTTR